MPNKPTVPTNKPLDKPPLHNPELYIVVAQFSKAANTWGSRVETHQILTIATDGEHAMSYTRLRLAKRHNLEPPSITILTYTRCNGNEAFLQGTDGNEYNVRLAITVVGDASDWEGTPTYVPNDTSIDKGV